MLFCLAAVTARASCAEDERSGRFTILHTNDFHGRYLAFEAPAGNALFPAGRTDKGGDLFARGGIVGGLAYLSTAVEKIRQERGPGNVILVHAGDAFGDDLLANLTHGEDMVCIMNAMGYQFMALGDHDFDYGTKQTEKLQKMAKFPMRGANVIVESTGEAFLGQPALVFSVGGLRVGMLALGCQTTPLSAGADAVAGLAFTKGTVEAVTHVSRLRSRSDVVVVVSHMGSEMDRVLAHEVPGIDIIIGGHTHEALGEKIITSGKDKGVWLVQALSNGVMLGDIAVTVNKGKIVSVNSSLRTIRPGAYKPEPAVARVIEWFRSAYRARLEEVITVALKPIERRYRRESPFDKLAGSILRRAAGAQIAFLAGAAYGIALGPGPVTREQLASLVAHPSPVVTMTLRGSQIRRILEKCAANMAPDNPLDAAGGLLQTDGIRWAVDLKRPMWQRVRSVSVNGAPLKDDGTYTVVTTKALLQGLYRYTTFSEGNDIRVHRTNDMDTIEEEFRKRTVIVPPETNDITVQKGDVSRNAAASRTART